MKIEEFNFKRNISTFFIKHKVINYVVCIGIILVILLVSILLVLLKNVNPETSNLFPPCIFYELTGIQCAGCGITRATHQILNFNFKEAFLLNPLIFLYIILFFLLLIRVVILKIHKKDVINILKKELNKFLYVLLAITLTFMILRNIINLLN